MYVCADFSISVDDVCSMPMAAVLHLLSSDVIFYICSFLEAKFILQSVSLVCKRFYHILSDVQFWRARLHEQWQKKYPLVPGEVFASPLGFQHNNLLFAGYSYLQTEVPRTYGSIWKFQTLSIQEQSSS